MLTAAAAVLAAVAPVRADDHPGTSDVSWESPAAEPVVPGAAGPPVSEAPPVRRKVEWSPNWPRFRWWEYAGTVVFGGTSLYLRYYRTLPPEPKWQGDNPVDNTIRDWLRADTRSGRESAGKASDYIYWAGVAFPFAVDLPVALFAHHAPGVAWQLLWMSLEANAVSGFITNALFMEAGRGRPSHNECAADPNYDSLCGATGNNASFPSGHTLGIATAAGLVCVDHRYLPLFGGGAGDIAACAVMGAATAATAITRIVADRHYFSDGLIGAAIGFATGYGLPWLLHYRAGLAPEGTPPTTAMPPVVLVPFGGPGTAGIGLVGLL